jgi:hypothetical protein
MKNVIFALAVTAAFIAGLYSLFLAAANAGRIHTPDVEGLVRTAMPADTGRIELALGGAAGQDLVYVVLYTADTGPAPEVETAARKAARAVAESGIAVSVRFLRPGEPDFATVVTQNNVDRFPAALVVKPDGGIVSVTNGITEKNLIDAYQTVWGKASSCDDASSAVY